MEGTWAPMKWRAVNDENALIRFLKTTEVRTDEDRRRVWLESEQRRSGGVRVPIGMAPASLFPVLPTRSCVRRSTRAQFLTTRGGGHFTQPLIVTRRMIESADSDSKNPFFLRDQKDPFLSRSPGCHQTSGSLLRHGISLFPRTHHHVGHPATESPFDTEPTSKLRSKPTRWIRIGTQVRHRPCLCLPRPRRKSTPRFFFFPPSLSPLAVSC